MRLSFLVLSILLTCAAGIPAADPEDKLIEDKSQKDKAKAAADHTELQEVDIKDLEDSKEIDEEVKRKKKSATTTFCVEIRPSGDQKPFQVCEPGYAAPAPQPHYPPSASNYGQEPQNSHVAPYQATQNQQKPAAAYSAPVKTFAINPAAPANKPYTPHTSYGTYRSNDDMEAEDSDATVMSMNAESEEDGSVEDTNMRSAYDTPHYSHGYGAPANGYGPSAASKKLHNHNGLVITCQPNLAGYAHNIPNYGHVPAAVPSYSYRAASGRYGRPYQQYRPQQQPYGSYQHATKPANKPSAYNQAPAYSPVYSPQPAYAPQSQAYKQPAYPSAGYRAPAGAPVYSQKPAAKPQAMYQSQNYGSSSQAPAQPQTYAAPPQPQTYATPAQPQEYAAPAHQQVYAAPAQTPAYAAPAYHEAPAHHSAPAYQEPTPSYQAPAPVPAYQAAAPAYRAPAAAPAYQAPAAAAPTYQAPAAAAPTYQAPAYQAPAPAPAYQAPPAAPPTYQAPAVHAAPAPSYSQSPAPYSPPAESPAFPPSYDAASYVAPGTYRDAEAQEEQVTDTDKNEKESHTLKKMEKISEQRAAGGRWGTEMSSEGKDVKKDERTVAKGNWREAGEEHQMNESEKARENEVDGAM